VVESRHGGGSMYTVGAAAERGIPVGAVPGSIRSPTSEGTNSLLADGCFPVCSVADVLAALSLQGVVLPAPARGGNAGAGPGQGRLRTEYVGPDRAVYDALSSDPVSLDQLVRITGMELAALCGGLERLAREGVARDDGGWWLRT
jgi:DNA processing protein